MVLRPVILEFSDDGFHGAPDMHHVSRDASPGDFVEVVKGWKTIKKNIEGKVMEVEVRNLQWGILCKYSPFLKTLPLRLEAVEQDPWSGYYRSNPFS